MPLINLVTTLGNFIGSNMIKKGLLGPRAHIFIGGFIGVVGVNLAAT